MTAKHPKAGKFLRDGLFDGLKSFADLERRLNPLSEKDKGDAFEVFAEAYCRVTPEIGASEFWPERATPAEVRRRLNLPARDKGFDGVLRSRDGRYTVLQVKYRAGRRMPSWRELSTWLAVSDRADGVLLFSNAEDLPPDARGRKRFQSVRAEKLDALKRADFQRIAAFLRGGKIERALPTPRPHQRRAVSDVLKALKNSDRAMALMACGTGKTLVGLWVAEALKAKTAIVFVPSIALVQQIMREWLGATKMKNAASMAVCSDPSVTPEEDSLQLDAPDLDFPVSTNPKEVRRFLASRAPGPKLIFCTYDSAWVVGKAMRRGERFDLGIFDEAHKTAGRVGRKFTFALSDRNLPIKKRLFMTATPRHYDVRRRTKDGELAEVFSMDSREVYGPVAHELSFRAAVQRRLICQFKVLISVVTSRDLGAARLAKGRVMIDGEELPARWVANQVALRRGLSRTKAHKAFTFHDRVAAAKDFAGAGPKGICAQVGSLKAFHVNGKMPVSERARELGEFERADRAVITNARYLTEGIDVPIVDMVAFLSPRRSRVDVIQAVGRAVRKSPGKKTGWVLVPLFLEIRKGERLDQAIQRQRFDAVWEILEALREQDEALAETTRLAAQEIGETGKIRADRLSRFVEIEGPAVGLAALKRGIDARLVNELAVSWDVLYGELIAYKREYSDANVPRSLGKLGAWCGTQRQFYKSHKLSNERVKKLEALGFSWNTLEDAWDARYDELTAYKRRHHNVNVPSNSGSLGGWCVLQRADYKQRRLSAERIRRLEVLGFIWDPIGDAWNLMYEDLKRYRRKNGDVNVPQSSGKLGKWCNAQRLLFRENNLSGEKARKLKAIGFVWNPKNAAWDVMYDALRRFKRKYGAVDATRASGKLGSWCAIQRMAYRQHWHSLSKDRIRKLEALGFHWDRRKNAWDGMYANLVRYKARHGHANPPRETGKLGVWCISQRRAYKIGRLDKNKIKKLQALGFILNPYEAAWETRYKELREYERGHGHANISRYSGNLGQWCHNQRNFYRRGRLSKEKIKRMEALGFVWNPTEFAWRAMFDELRQYHREHGNVNFPVNSSQLGRWCNTQRGLYRRGKLSKDKIKMMETSGFVWNPFEIAWRAMFDELRRYKNAHGNVNIPVDSGQLGSWCRTQRYSYKLGKLSKDRIKKLENLGFVSKPGR